VTARARAEAARLLRGADGAALGAGEARGADGDRPAGDGELRGPDSEFLGPGGGAPDGRQADWDQSAPDQSAPDQVAQGQVAQGPAAQGPAAQGPAAQEQAGRERPERVRPRGKRIIPALRRLVVTPTFAAGLGVVVAAFLAANMSRAVLHFSAPIPGNQCTSGDCHVHVQEPHGGTLASARPGVHITPSVPSASGPATGLRPGGTASAAGGGGGPQPSVGSRPVSITYQQVEHWPGGFADQITISGLSGTRARAWSLAFGYPGSRIAGVQGARWELGSPGAGVARGVAWPGWGQGQSSADPVRLMVIVNGQPGAPSGCTLDGVPCTFAQPETP
jgi:hypothetical protein